MPASDSPQTAVPSAFSGGPARQSRFFLSLIIFVWAVIYLSTIFQPPLMDDADTVHAEAAREMAASGDWVTLHINGDGANDSKISGGIRYLEKAPLMYWAVAASFKVFGVHDWSARLPIALGVLALLLVTYRLGRRVFKSEEAGLYSALVLATGFGPFIYTRFLIPDMMVGLWLALGFDFFLTTLESDQEQSEPGQKERREKPSVWICWALAATMALNILTKGLIGLVFPIGAIFLYLLLTRNLRHLPRLRLISSFLVFLIIAAPWHLLAGFRNPAQGQAKGFFWFYFINEHFLRYLNKRFPADYDTVPLWLFWGLTLLWLMPWTAFIVQALRQVPVKLSEFRNGLNAQQRGTLLFALWAALILVFFSFSSRQEYYVLPGLPGLALLLGGWLAQEGTSRIDGKDLHNDVRRSGRISSAGLMVIGMAACVACFTLAMQAKTPPANYDIAELLKENPQDYALSFGHFLDLTPQAMGAFKTPLILTGLAFAIGTVLNWWLRRGNRTMPANLALALMMIVLLHAAHQGLTVFAPVLSSKVLAEAIDAHWQPGALIEDNGDYEAASSVNYYTHRQIRILNGRCNNIWYGSTFPDAPPIFDDDASFEKLWSGDQPVFLLVDGRAKQATGKKGGKDAVCPQRERLPDYVNSSTACVLAKWGGKLVLTQLRANNERTACPAWDPSR